MIGVLRRLLCLLTFHSSNPYEMRYDKEGPLAHQWVFRLSILVIFFGHCG
jgi:hypothetical protein